MSADGAIVISIPKSGTHLVAKLMTTLGYKVRGVGGEPWTGDEEAYGGVWAEMLGLLPELCNSDGFYWRHNLNQQYKWGARKTVAPFRENQCLVIHELYLDRIDGEIYRSWAENGEPKLIFNYRDPRACITSYVHFLRDSRDRMAPSPIQLCYRRILNEFDEFSDALMYAICDPKFPGMSNFRNMRWLLHHPDVLNTKYENWIGLDTIGEITRVLKHLGQTAPMPPPDLYDRNSPTFRTGLVDGWQKDWDGYHRNAFAQRYADVMLDYGYGQ